MSTLEGAVARVRASVWASVLGRFALGALALALLTWIGAASRKGLVAESQAAASPLEDSGGPDTSASSSIPADVATVPPQPSPAPSITEIAARAGPASESAPVYVNVASVEELRRLPGVGPKRAAAIVALRTKMGRFSRIEDMMRVKGIGRAAIKKWRPLVRLDSPDAG